MDYGIRNRTLRGKAIAEEGNPRRNRVVWIVPSQNRGAKAKFPYEVNLTPRAKTCTCPDFELTGQKCKHIYAIEHTVAKKTDFRAPDLSGPVKPTYSQDWTAYNAAQTNEKNYVTAMLKSLCAGIEEPVQTRGRPRISLADMIFSMTMKVYGGDSGRRSMCDIREFAEKALVEKSPHYNSISRYFEKPELTPILNALVEESAAPLRDIEVQFAADSSGFALTNMSNWNSEKWGRYGKQSKAHDWLELHAMVGVKTNIITSAVITGEHGGDAKQFSELVDSTAKRFMMERVCADKAYLSARNFEAAERVGATPFIPFKSNSIKDGIRSTELWRKAFHFFQYHRSEFLEHYHKRSNVEATFSMIKRKFGEKLRSKTRVAQENELLCKCLCHNLAVLVGSIFEMGIGVEFWGNSPKQAA